jgi:hypothetical protein
MKKIMHILFLSCLKASEFIEKKIHFKLSFTEKIQLKLHKMMCSACARYEKQSLLLEKQIEFQTMKPINGKTVENLKKTISEKLKA